MPLFALGGIGGCGHAEDPNCDFSSDLPSYHFSAVAPATTGALCDVVFSGDATSASRDASYTFPPLRECSDKSAPLRCTVVSGPEPATCELDNCTLTVDFPGAKGQEISDYLGHYALPYAVTCDDSTTLNGSLEPYLVCAQ